MAYTHISYHNSSAIIRTNFTPQVVNSQLEYTSLGDTTRILGWQILDIWATCKDIWVQISWHIKKTMLN